MPDAPIRAYILNNPAANPITGQYVEIGWATGSNIPQDGNDTAPYYDWSITSNPIASSQWPSGGIARFRVDGQYNGSPYLQPMATFDDQGMLCLMSHEDDPWRDAGNVCRSPYGTYDEIITVVSNATTPDDLHPVDYLGYGGDHQYFPEDHQDPNDPQSPLAGWTPEDFEQDTLDYYDAIDAPENLDDFKQRHGFPSGEVRAIYYNRGDLGIGRDMHCKKYTPAGQPSVTACYVTNYGRVPNGAQFTPSFGSPDPQLAINQTIDGSNPVATVAMVHDPSNVDNPVQFIVYNGGGDKDPYAALDNPGVVALGHTSEPTHANINVPDNCLTCHGASATYTRGPGASIQGAAFLPFDEEAMVFAQFNTTWSKSKMVPRLKRLNTFVWDTAPPQAVLDLLRGMYGGTPNGPKDVNSAFTPSYVPVGWQTN
ncbi:MAG: hypothetical protein R3F14_17920, partial [Polyangiaceae bacterium]